MKIIKRIDPSTLPWGIPLSTLVQFDSAPFKVFFCLLFLGMIPSNCRLVNIPHTALSFWGITDVGVKPFWKSRYIKVYGVNSTILSFKHTRTHGTKPACSPRFHDSIVVVSSSFGHSWLLYTNLHVRSSVLLYQTKWRMTNGVRWVDPLVVGYWESPDTWYMYFLVQPLACPIRT